MDPTWDCRFFMPNNRDPKPEEAAACRDYLERQIEMGIVPEGTRLSPRDEEIPAWETLNDTYAYASENKATATTRRGRYAYLRHIIDYCHMLGGKLSGTMSHDQTYDFLRMGRNMERADMTTRVIDVRGSNLLPTHSEELKPFDDIQWKSVLDSLAAYQMYRRQVHVRVFGKAVLRFLLQDSVFPRAVQYTLSEVEHCLRSLPGNEAALRVLGRAQRMVQRVEVSGIVHAGLTDFINELQLSFIELHAELSSTYFEGKEISPDMYPREQSQVASA